MKLNMRSRPNGLSRRLLSDRWLWLFLVLGLCLLGSFWEFAMPNQWLGLNPVSSALKCLLEAWAMVSFYWVVRPRWRWIFIVLNLLTDIYFLANTINDRFYATFLSPSALFQAGNVDSELTGAILGVVRPADLVWIVCALLPIGFYIAALRGGKRTQWMTPKLKWGLAASGLLAFALAQVSYSFSTKRTYGFSHSKRIERILTECSDATYLREAGLPLTLLKSSLELVTAPFEKPNRQLSLEEKRMVEEFLNRTGSASGVADFAPNRDRNLILVVVESLNSSVIGQTVEGREVAPVMNGLMNQEGTISTTSMVCQTADGNSSDGQLMMNTGLLPLKKGFTMPTFNYTNTFPALAEILGRGNRYGFFADNGQFWNKWVTFENFGFQHSDIVCLKDFEADADRSGRDGAMFSAALKRAGDYKRPFLMEMLSFSTHSPFNMDKAVGMQGWIADAPGLSEKEKAYANAFNYFDTQLGLFIEGLKEAGLWDDTILVLVSDHHIMVDSEKAEATPGYDLERDERCVFIATNTGHSARIERTSGQVNVFPTLLEIMGAEGSYRGLGPSLLDSTLDAAVTRSGLVVGDPGSASRHRMAEAWDVSRLMLRGDWFGRGR